ncbi:hypothetical protein EVAR_82027_1 [Eumeta japonica]|uniref:HTH CENPB-type domain-containing protein n=1 Tax=Eumeta variegata TaxID=151549 RepID=A0A4C1XN05_EUMVA|nr:hypothetical protein EVAR_82027_1 [Eumeta japonica]
MPRSKDNIKRTSIAKTALFSAIKLVNEKKCSLRGATKHFNLRHYEHCLKTGKDASDLHDNLAAKKGFIGNEELLLVDYTQEAGKLQYGLTSKDVKRLAYEFAMKNNKKYPAQWDKDQMAGEYWLRLFRKRHQKQLALCKPEAISIARSTAFNKQNVQLTYENYKKLCPNAHN